MRKIFWKISMALLLFPIVLFGQNPYYVAMQTKDWARAVEIKQQESSANPGNSIYAFELADAQTAAGETEAAKQTLQKILQSPGNDAYAELAQGRLDLLNGQVESAESHFEKAAKKGRRMSEVPRFIGTAYLYGEKRDLVKAERRLLDSYNMDNENYAGLLTLGYAYTELLDGGNAVLFYERAMRKDPKSPLPVYMIAKTYQKAKLADRYTESLNNTIAVDSTFQPALRDLAEYQYFTKRDFAAAVDAYGKLVNRVQDVRIEDKMQYVNSLFLARRYPETIEWVDKIVNEDGSKNYLRRLAAYSYYETDNTEKGLSIMQDYFSRVTPDKVIPSDYEYYGKLLEKSGQDSLALNQYLLAVGADSARWQLYDQIGQIQYKLKQYDQAAVSFRMRLDSVESPTAIDYYRIGLAHYATQDSAAYEQAAQYFGKVSELNPTAVIGWWMQARTLAKLEPDIQAEPEKIDSFGRAQPAFEKFAELAAADPEKNKANLITAYEYLTYYYYIRKDNEAAKAVIAKLQALDPENATAKEISQSLATGAGTE